jgi:hypothetical protein
MSNPTNSKNAPGFVWLLGAFAGFAVLAAVLQSLFSAERSDPRAAERLANWAEISAAQQANLQKMGLEQGKSSAALAKGLSLVSALAPAKSNMVVPGSPTQLKQAATAAPAAPAPAAPAPAK